MKLRIYPSIGIARLGNGPATKEDVVFTPEVPWKNIYDTTEVYHTANGALKKQAQRFYIYECDDQGNPTQKFSIEEYKKTHPDAKVSITWTVEVANKKPFWYDFNNSLDLSIKDSTPNLSPNFANPNSIAPGIGASRRNPNVLDEKLIQKSDVNFRQELVNSPSAVTVSDEPNQTKKEIGGQFPFPLKGSQNSNIAAAMNTNSRNVNLGTVEYDNGNLIFYPGDGISAALNPSDLNTDFADNSNWYDDICDGKVTAVVTIDGTTYNLDTENEAAWIATAPPDYAPQIQPLATMYDLICGIDNKSYDTDFSLIFPILYRLYRMQWVNLSDFLSPSFRETIDQLTPEEFSYLYSLPADQEAAKNARLLRETIFNSFRDPLYNYNNEPIIPSKNKTDLTNLGSGTEELKYPFYPGDGINYPGSPAQWFAIPPILYEELKKWRDGNFTPLSGSYTTMDQIGLYYQAQYIEASKDGAKSALLMTRAVLETLYGGGFHPGVELTWPMRHKQMYSQNAVAFSKVTDNASFFGLREIRIAVATPEQQEAVFYKDFGFEMTSDNIAASLAGDADSIWLWQITPGDLTKWMGIPWQSDAGSCQKVFLDSQYPIPAWWAANLPVDVLTEESLVAMRNETVTPETKQYIYANRTPWLMTTDTGFVGYHAEGGYMNGLINMVYKWKDVGVVAAREAQTNGIPELVYVAAESKNVRDKMSVFLGKSFPKTDVTLTPPSIYYSNERDMVWIPEGKQITLSSKPDGTGDINVDDELEVYVNGQKVASFDFSGGGTGNYPKPPQNVTTNFNSFLNSFVTIKVVYKDLHGGKKEAYNLYISFH
ncbi:conserved hypothetical protein [Tenacibaculum sp. 190524A02b]|uniref:Uncharacterized protein n=1 Tax=Tenacibaculum vairaonense TaxID=3137860 RepID=A0ABM9PHY7_9FLAO